MTPAPPRETKRELRGVAPVSRARAIAFGGLTIGVLDGLDAVVFFGLRGAPAERIFQAIAAGLLGPPAFDGGLKTAALGVALHFFIATVIAAVACLLMHRFPALRRRALLTGAVYGIGVWLVMNFVVIPMSAIGSTAPSLPVVINGLAIHVLGVGIPAFFFARLTRAAAGPRLA